MSLSPSQLTLFDLGQPLVHSVAMSIMRRLPVRADLDDLIGYGQVGLAEAVLRFEEQRDIQFTTFAYYRIKGAIFDGVSKMSWTSRARLNRLRHLRAASETQQTQENGAQRLAAEQLVRYVLTNRFASDGDAANDEMVEDPGFSPMMVAANREIAVRLRDFVAALPRLSRVLIESVYYEGLTLHQAARQLGISKSWASRVHAQALQHLALALRRVGIDQ